MKLLGWTWMHRKSQKNVDESFKSFATGEPSFEEQSHCPKRSYSLTPSWQRQKESLVRKSFAGFDTVRVEDVLEEDPSAAIFDLFHGLFAIGTLGSEKLITEPATPTFGVSAEYKTHGYYDEIAKIIMEETLSSELRPFPSSMIDLLGMTTPYKAPPHQHKRKFLPDLQPPKQKRCS